MALDPSDATGRTFLAGTGNIPDNVTAMPWQGAGVWQTVDGGLTYQRTLNATFAPGGRVGKPLLSILTSRDVFGLAPIMVSIDRSKAGRLAHGRQ